MAWSEQASPDGFGRLASMLAEGAKASARSLLTGEWGSSLQTRAPELGTVVWRSYPCSGRLSCHLAVRLVGPRDDHPCLFSHLCGQVILSCLESCWVVPLALVIAWVENAREAGLECGHPENEIAVCSVSLLGCQA